MVAGSLHRVVAVALNVGYQLRFDEAEALFVRAEPLIGDGGAP